MSSRKNWFEYMKALDGGDVFLGDNNTTSTIGIGNIWVRMFDGTTRVLKGVRYVSGLRRI